MSEKSIQHSRRISWQFCNDHLPQGKKTVYEFHVLGFLSLLFHGRAGVISRVAVEPAVPRAVLQALGLLSGDLAPFLAAFVLALHPYAHALFLVSWLRYSGGRGDSTRIASLLQQSTLSFRHHSKGRRGLLNNSKCPNSISQTTDKTRFSKCQKHLDTNPERPQHFSYNGTFLLNTHRILHIEYYSPKMTYHAPKIKTMLKSSQ